MSDQRLSLVMKIKNLITKGRKLKTNLGNSTERLLKLTFAALPYHDTI